MTAQAIELSDAQLLAWIGQYLWPFFRIAAFFSIVPILGARLVPVQVRVLLALGCATLIAPLLPSMPMYSGLDLGAVIISVQQVLIGLALGFIVTLILQIFVLAGQAISMQMGLGFASMVDPINGVTVPVLSQWYLVWVTLAFVSINGHLAVLEALIDSFTTLPIALSGLSPASLVDIALAGSALLRSGLAIALPSITALLLVNLTFGVMTRAAPQLNVFALGFPITLIMGLVILWLSHTFAVEPLQALVLNHIELMRQLH